MTSACAQSPRGRSAVPGHKGATAGVRPAPPGEQKTSRNPSLWQECVKPLEEGQQNLLPTPTPGAGEDPIWLETG